MGHPVLDHGRISHYPCSRKRLFVCALLNGRRVVTGQWRRARFKVGPLSISLVLLLLLYVAVAASLSSLKHLSAFRAVALIALGVVPCAVLAYMGLSFRLHLSEAGVVLRLPLGVTRRARWDEVRSFLLTDDYRVILKVAGAREIVIVPGMYRDPERVVEELAQYLGEPRLEETDFELLGRQFFVLAIVAAACSVPLILLSSPISLAVGFGLGVPLGAYLLMKQYGPVARRRGFRFHAGVIGWWGVLLSMTLGAVLPKLLGVGPAPNVLFLVAGASGYVVGSLVVFGVVNKVGARRGRR